MRSWVCRGLVGAAVGALVLAGLGVFVLRRGETVTLRTKTGYMIRFWAQRRHWLDREPSGRLLGA